MRKIVAVLLSLSIIAVACGDDDGGVSSGQLNESEQALTDAIAQAILEDDEDSDSPLGPAEAECIGEGSVRRIGVDGLGEIGITQDNPNPQNVFQTTTEEQLDAILDVFLECVDLTQAFVQSFEEDGMGPETIECLTKELDDEDLLRAIMRAGMADEEFDFAGDPELSARLVEIVLGCISAEDLVNLGE